MKKSIFAKSVAVLLIGSVAVFDSCSEEVELSPEQFSDNFEITRYKITEGRIHELGKTITPFVHERDVVSVESNAVFNISVVNN